MKRNLRCLLGHDWGPWKEVGSHLESKCARCPETRAKYPSGSAIFARFLVDCGWKVLDHELSWQRRRNMVPTRGRVT